MIFLHTEAWGNRKSKRSYSPRRSDKMAGGWLNTERRTIIFFGEMSSLKEPLIMNEMFVDASRYTRSLRFEG